MFVELVRGRAVGPADLHLAWDGVLAGISGEAEGWLGATSGVTGDGEFFALLGFASEEFARSTMGKLHLRAMWDPLAPRLAGLSFRELPYVRVFGLADLGDAGLVHVTCGPANDIGRLVSVFDASSAAVPADTAEGALLGGLLAWDEAAFAVSALYRRSFPAAAAAEVSPDPVREVAAVLFDHAVELDLASPASILVPPGLPPRDHGSGVPG